MPNRRFHLPRLHLPRLPLPRLPFLTLTVALGALAVHWVPAWTDLLECHRAAVAEGEIYRVLTGHLTHWSWKHLAYDVAAFVILGIAVELRSRWHWVVCVAGTALASSSALWLFRPDITAYRGLSAIDSALFAVFALELALEVWRSRDSNPPGLVQGSGPSPGSRLVALAIPGLLVAKMLYEAVTGSALFADVGGVAVLPELHLLGALVGALALKPALRPEAATG